MVVLFFSTDGGTALWLICRYFLTAESCQRHAKYVTNISQRKHYVSEAFGTDPLQ